MDINKKHKEKYYEQKWFMYLLLFLFPPVGIYLLWKYDASSTKTKMVLTIISLSLVIIIGGNKSHTDDKIAIEPKVAAVETKEVVAEVKEVKPVVEEKKADPQPAKTYAMLDINAYKKDSPEFAVASYLSAWKNKQWDKMAEYTQLTWRSTENTPGTTLESFYNFKNITGAEIKSVSNKNDMAADVDVIIQYTIGDAISTKTMKAKVIREVAPQQPSPAGTWGVNPISALREE